MTMWCGGECVLTTTTTKTKQGMDRADDGSERKKRSEDGDKGERQIKLASRWAEGRWAWQAGRQKTKKREQARRDVAEGGSTPRKIDRVLVLPRLYSMQWRCNALDGQGGGMSRQGAAAVRRCKGVESVGENGTRTARLVAAGCRSAEQETRLTRAD